MYLNRRKQRKQRIRKYNGSLLLCFLLFKFFSHSPCPLCLCGEKIAVAKNSCGIFFGTARVTP